MWYRLLHYICVRSPRMLAIETFAPSSESNPVVSGRPVREHTLILRSTFSSMVGLWIRLAAFRNSSWSLIWAFVVPTLLVHVVSVVPVFGRPALQLQTLGRLSNDLIMERSLLLSVSFFFDWRANTCLQVCYL